MKTIPNALLIKVKNIIGMSNKIKNFYYPFLILTFVGELPTWGKGQSRGQNQNPHNVHLLKL